MFNSSCLIQPSLLVIALLLDRLLGEPPRWHPLVGFGQLASFLEKHCNRISVPILSRLCGLVAYSLLVSPFVFVSYFLSQLTYGWFADLILLYFALGARSLKLHALRIEQALSSKDLAKARLAVAMIVSRDTHTLQQTEIATASVESVLENGNDAIFGAIFWFLLFGGAGAVAYRLANTLDAMWGYRTPRFLYFGWAAARLDDLFNLIPARLTAFSYALVGHFRLAMKCWYTQARHWYSPNAGPVISAGAGALNVLLGGPASYHGELKQRPLLGEGQTATPQHILDAIRLVERSEVLWCIIVTLIYVILCALKAFLGGTHA